MIVVAIIGILAAVASALLSRYVREVQADILGISNFLHFGFKPNIGAFYSMRK